MLPEQSPVPIDLPLRNIADSAAIHVSGAHMAKRSFMYASVLAVGAVVVCGSEPALAAGDVLDQFFRYTEGEHRVFAQELPGETVDPFTGTLRIVQTDLVLPGKAGLDLKIIR